MSLDSDDTIKPDSSSAESASRKADASVVLNQLRINKVRDGGDSEFRDGNSSIEEIFPPADTASHDDIPPAGTASRDDIPPAGTASRDDIPPDTDEIRRKLENDDADRKIREQLAGAQVWEEKQKAIEEERGRQRREIEREIEADSRKKSVGKLKRNAIAGAAIIIFIIAIGVLTFSVQPNLPATQDSFPYVSSYNVRIPQGEPVDFAGIPVTVSGSGDKVIVSINGGLGTEIGVGDKITLSSPKRMVIRIFGISLFDSDYQIVATFRGYVSATSQNDFALAVMTTRPVPEWALGIIMPDGVDVNPISGDNF